MQPSPLELTVPVKAVLPTNLQIAAGDYVSISGPSGSGKSTLLNMLGLLDRPSGGRYMLNGRDVASLGERERSKQRLERIGFVFQSFHLLDGRTTLENVALPLLYQGIGRNRRYDMAAQALELVGLAHRLYARPETLSGGEKQRCAVARAMITKPSVLLCDEPTGNLDSGSATSVVELVEELNRSGVTVVLVTHDRDLAQKAGRRITVRDGRVSEERPS